MHYFFYIGIALLPYSTLSAAQYVPPKESQKVLIKLDKVPLTPQTLQWTSHLLADIAHCQLGGNAKQLHTSAKLMAVANLLTPANPRLQKTNQSILAGSPLDKKRASSIKRKSQRLWVTIEFLASHAAGTEAHNLSLYLKDAMRGVSPAHPALKNFQAPATLWLGIVADPKRFKSTSTQ